MVTLNNEKTPRTVRGIIEGSIPQPEGFTDIKAVNVSRIDEFKAKGYKVIIKEDGVDTAIIGKERSKNEQKVQKKVKKEVKATKKRTKKSS